MSTDHNLKIDPAQFTEVAANLKRFEFRKEDTRTFERFDMLTLHETTPGNRDKFTGSKCRRIVTSVLRGPLYNVPDGYCIMSIRPLTNVEKEDRK